MYTTIAMLPMLLSLLSLLSLVWLVPAMVRTLEGGEYAPLDTSADEWAASLDVALGEAWFQDPALAIPRIEALSTRRPRTMTVRRTHRVRVTLADMCMV